MTGQSHALSYPSFKIYKNNYILHVMEYVEANKSIKQWGKKVKDELKTSIVSSGIVHSGKSDSPKAAADSLTLKTHKSTGLIDKLGYKIPRHMIYVHKGAGRGYGGSSGSKWITNNGVEKTTNRSSLGKQGTGKRKAKEWYNPVIDRNIEDLANVVADKLGADIINQLLIK